MKTLMPRPLIVSGIIAVSAFGASADISDNFDDNNDTGWTFTDAGGGTGSRSVSGGAYTLGGVAVASTRADQLFDNGTFRADVKSWATGVPGGHSFGIAFHFNPATLSGYAFTIDEDNTPEINFIKFAGGILAGSGTGSGTLTLDQVADDYTLEVIAFGGNFTGNLYSKIVNPGQLVSTVSYFDTDFGQNQAGLLVVHDTPTLTTPLPSATFDNFFASSTPVPEPGTLALFGTGAVLLGAAIRRRR